MWCVDNLGMFVKIRASVAKGYMTQRAIDGDYIYFVTANVQSGRWFFVSPERAERLGRAIQTCCAMKNFDLLAYCILPNHVHLLVRKPGMEMLGQASIANRLQRTLERVRCEGMGRPKKNRRQSTERKEVFLFPHRRLSSRRSFPAGQGFTLGDLMKSIKGTFSRTLPKGKFWQHRSYFRIIDNEEYLSNVVEYIQGNYTKMNLDDRFGQPLFVFMDWGKIHILS